MQLASVGRTRLCCSVPAALLVPLAVLFSKAELLLVCLLSLAAHELAHAFMAHRLGFAVEAVEIQPFGFIARLAGGRQSPAQAAAIAAAGPTVSLLLALVSSGIRLIAGGVGAGVSEFTRFNLSVGLINLLPVLPLDGGRLALAAIEAKCPGRERARGAGLLCALGVLLGLSLAAAGLAPLVMSISGAKTKPPAGGVSFIITGAFIAAAAFGEKKYAAGGGAAQLLSRRSRLKSGQSVRVTAVAMHRDATVGEALRAVTGAGYGAVLVTDDELKTIGVADEGMLMEAVLRGGSGERLGSLLR